jgi:hypothetical protein
METEAKVYTHFNGFVYGEPDQRIAAPEWYKKPSLIPYTYVDAAKEKFFAMSDSFREYEWRILNFNNLCTGYAPSVKCSYPHFMEHPEEALNIVVGWCYHNWEKVRDYDSTNKVLGTYDRGHINKCPKCNEEEYVRTSYNNYSGD